MKTKQEYIDALNRMVEVYDNLDGCMSAINIFNEGVHLLEGLVNEHFEEKQETNLEHHFEYLSTVGIGGFALINGKCVRCSDTDCSECDFSCDCCKKRLIWLASPYRKPTYKLNQFEYDLLQHFSVDFKFKEMGLLKEMKEKGHFKNINGDELIKDILESCEVIK